MVGVLAVAAAASAAAAADVAAADVAADAAALLALFSLSQPAQHHNKNTKAYTTAKRCRHLHDASGQILDGSLVQGCMQHALHLRRC